MMIQIKNLHATVEKQEILKGINLTVHPGEVHAIMGPNGSGKSTLSNVIAGRPEYQITQGEIRFLGQNLSDLSIEDRSKAGIFLGFQYPIEIPGVSNVNFLKTAVNQHRAARGEVELDAMDFLGVVQEKLQQVQMDPKFLRRSVNVGFSGGEKKRNEILQLLLLNPKLAILDETDSGLDIDALKVVSDGINTFRSKENATILVTHYQRLLDYVVPDFVHILVAGKIVMSGDKSLAFELEEKGYDRVLEKTA